MPTVQINDYQIKRTNGIREFVLFFDNPTSEHQTKTQITLGSRKEHWKNVTFTYVGEPEIDVDIFPANPLHCGKADFDVLAIRLPKSWMEFRPTHQT